MGGQVQWRHQQRGAAPDPSRRRLDRGRSGLGRHRGGPRPEAHYPHRRRRCPVRHGKGAREARERLRGPVWRRGQSRLFPSDFDSPTGGAVSADRAAHASGRGRARQGDKGTARLPADHLNLGPAARRVCPLRARGLPGSAYTVSAGSPGVSGGRRAGCGVAWSARAPPHDRELQPVFEPAVFGPAAAVTRRHRRLHRGPPLLDRRGGTPRLRHDPEQPGCRVH